MSLRAVIRHGFTFYEHVPAHGQRAFIPKGEFRGRKGLPDDFVDRMHSDYLTLHSIAKVARLYGRTRQSVYESFARRGLRLYSKKPPKEEREYHGLNYTPNNDGYLRCTKSGFRKHLHVVIWEERNGPVPARCQIIFKDGNKRNFDPNNLVCLTIDEALARVRTGANQFTKGRARVELKEAA